MFLGIFNFNSVLLSTIKNFKLKPKKNVCQNRQIKKIIMEIDSPICFKFIYLFFFRLGLLIKLLYSNCRRLQ